MLDRYMNVLFKQYYKDDSFIAGFVARNILALVILIYLIDLFLLLNFVGLISMASIKDFVDRKTLIFVSFLIIRFAIEFTTKSNKSYEEALNSAEEDNNYNDKYNLVWAIVIGSIIFFLLGFL